MNCGGGNGIPRSICFRWGEEHYVLNLFQQLVPSIMADCVWLRVALRQHVPGAALDLLWAFVPLQVNAAA